MLPTIREIVALVVVCVIYLVGWSILQQEQAHSRRAKKLPIYGTRNEWLPWLQARVRSFEKTSVWIAEGYHKVRHRRPPSLPLPFPLNVYLGIAGKGQDAYYFGLASTQGSTNHSI
ncbi:hypothetical protein GGR54DRAFT_115945 [Hypoxylon sp. NC1633]|nr:hypothetical protein GGR54DRAFT_115945 [Hypoxylon sp. NC1633]